MPDRSYADRNRDIVRLYSEGVPGTELAGRYCLTRQRIDQILKASSAIDAAQARSVRLEKRSQAFQASVRDFIEQHGDTLHSLAAAGATLADAERHYAHLEPEVPANVVREAVTKSNAPFKVNRQQHNLTQPAVEAGLLYVLARTKKLPEDPPAPSQTPPADTSDIAQTLAELGATTESTRKVLLSIAAARQRVASDPDLTISRKQYDEQRDSAIKHLGLPTQPGTPAWPPTSQTVTRRLGGGYWTDALASVGITASGKGRNRRLLVPAEPDQHHHPPPPTTAEHTVGQPDPDDAPVDVEPDPY